MTGRRLSPPSLRRPEPAEIRAYVGISAGSPELVVVASNASTKTVRSNFKARLHRQWAASSMTRFTVLPMASGIEANHLGNPSRS